MYIAARALDLGNGQRREIGDPVPEAVSWRNLRAYVSQRWVLQVPEPGSALRLDQLDIDTQIRIRRLGIERKLVGLGILVGAGDGPAKTVAEVGQEIAHGARITTGEIETATAAPEPMAEEPTPDEGGALKRLVTAKRKKGKR